MSTDTTFFARKRSWSEIKDRILGAYMRPYLTKVATLQKPILLVDAFAGQGLFGEGPTAKWGSPLILSSMAKDIVPNQYRAYFANRNKRHHAKLTKALFAQGLLTANVHTVHGDATSFLDTFWRGLRDETVFVYLDPFGLQGCTFDVIRPFLERSRSHSTEILINMSTKTLHRLAARHSMLTGQLTPLIHERHKFITRVLGGEFWKDIMFDPTLSPAQRETRVMDHYVERLKEYLPYSGYCPIQEMPDGPTKYYMAFCSRHQDSLVLMNDIMVKAYAQYMHEVLHAGTLFEAVPWQEMPWPWRGDLAQVTMQSVRDNPGRSRKQIWISILGEHFKQWTESEFRSAVNDLAKRGILSFRSPTNRLNDKAQIFPK